MKRTINARTVRLRLLGISVVSAMLTPQLALAQDGVEWDPQKGYHEEEWYDPSDWFDDDSTVDYESDYDYDGYDYYDRFWEGLLWYDDYDYEADEDSGSDFVWNETTEEWELSDTEVNNEFSAKYEFEDTPAAQSSQSSRSSQSGESMQASQSSQSNKPKQSEQSSQADQSTASNSSSTRSTQASQSTQSGPKQSNQAQASSGQGASQQSADSLKGEVEAFRKIDVTYEGGIEETHALARVALDNGETAVVDLGLASFFNADLKKGDQVTLHGSRGSIDGRDVFVATELTSKSETAYIDRTIAMQEQGSSRSGSSTASQGRSGERSAQQSSGPQSSQSNQVVLEGKVAEQETVQLQGESESQSFVKIELQNGRAATVKLGPETSAQQLNLQKGDQIRIQGQRDQIEGKDVVVARSIRVEGERVKG